MKRFVALTATAFAVSMCGGASSRAQAASPACVPAQLASAAYPVMLVNVRVNGRGPYTFFVDTGATVTIVNAPLAQTLKLKPLSIAVQGVGAGGRFSTRASNADISVGGVHQDNLLVATFDLTQIGTAIGHVDGALGYNFLKAYRVTIDYPGRKLCLADGA